MDLRTTAVAHLRQKRGVLCLLSFSNFQFRTNAVSSTMIWSNPIPRRINIIYFVKCQSSLRKSVQFPFTVTANSWLLFPGDALDFLKAKATNHSINTLIAEMIDVKCLPTCLCVLLAEWKCNDHVQRGFWDRGGSGKYPLLPQLCPEAQRISHFCHWVPRPGCSRPEERPLWSVSTVP